MTVSDIIRKTEELYPPHLAEEWDNVGLLVGDRDKEVRKVLIALDASDQAVERAVSEKADLILTHHPLIFKPLKRVTADDRIGRRILKMAAAGISYYAMHTNFDIAGMAALNEGELGLIGTAPLAVTGRTEEEDYGFGRIGHLKEAVTVRQYASYVKEVYDLPDVRIYGDPEKKISRVAVCSGSGRSFVGEALRNGAEVYVTGDIDYHTAIDAVSDGLILLDAGHYGTEFGYIAHMAGKIAEWFPEIEVICEPIAQPYTSI